MYKEQVETNQSAYLVVNKNFKALTLLTISDTEFLARAPRSLFPWRKPGNIHRIMSRLQMLNTWLIRS